MNPYRANEHHHELIGRPPLQRHWCWLGADLATLWIAFLIMTLMMNVTVRELVEVLRQQQAEIDACNYEEPRAP